jgi:Spy/CpxP family protein refolding chaperone
MVKSFRRFFVVPLAAILFFSAGSISPLTAEARHPHFRGSGDLEMFFFHKAVFYLSCADELGLTEDQVEKIKGLKMGVKKELIRKESELEILKLDIESALREKQIDVKAVNALVDKKYEIAKAKTKFLVQSLADLKRVLSEEQHAKAKSLWRKKF